MLSQDPWTKNPQSLWALASCWSALLSVCFLCVPLSLSFPDMENLPSILQRLWQAGWRRVGFSSSGSLYSRHIEAIPKHFLDEIKLTVWKRSNWHKATSHWDSDSEGKFRILLKKRENYWRRSTLVLHGGKDNSPCRACPTSSQSRKHLHTPSLSSNLRERVT